MKAIILAGGKGTRGKPYTDYIPKAMIPVNDKPLIDYIVRYMKSFNFIDEIIIISDFDSLGGQIKNYFAGQKNITFVQDSQNGTGGDLLHAEGKIGNSEFILWFADNLCAVDLNAMKELFSKKNMSACIATRTKRKEETGFALVDNDMIIEFKEKPTINLQLSECLGIYMLAGNIIKEIKSTKKPKVNLSFDVLQPLSKKGNVGAFDIGVNGWIDVQSPIVLERNDADVQKIIKQMGF